MRKEINACCKQEREYEVLEDEVEEGYKHQFCSLRQKLSKSLRSQDTYIHTYIYIYIYILYVRNYNI
jgi:hypothetical protein